MFAAMFVLWFGLPLIFAMRFEARGNPKLTAAGRQPAGHRRPSRAATWRARRSASGPSTCGYVRRVDDQHLDRRGQLPARQPAPRSAARCRSVNMMFGEVSPGGTGSGLYGMLIFALLAVFIAGLMVGRTPEYLGKKIQAAGDEAGRALHPASCHWSILGFAGASVVLQHARSARSLNTGPHGLTEMIYAYTSASNNNGSAFGGLTGNTQWYNTTLGIVHAGRPVLPDDPGAGHRRLARPQADGARHRPGTFPTGTPLFAGLLLGVVIIVVGLTYFPVVALGPVVEHLVGNF